MSEVRDLERNDLAGVERLQNEQRRYGFVGGRRK